MRFISLIVISCLLIACQQPSVQQQALLRLQASALACEKQEKKSEQCTAIKKKYDWTSKALMRLQSNPQQFGHEVLVLQTRISELKEQTLTPSISKKMAKFQSELDGHIALIALFESPQ